ncbi:IS630 family transposase [Methyloglobulus sp.]|uniref:IS630 family transposase n=1 Tax=Methyloglobulus sp. TaxID=2518622 RepID=UPI003988DCC1
MSVGQPEKAWIILYPDTAFAEKKRCPERFKAAQENLKRCQTAARAGKLSLFYPDGSGFSNIPNVQRAWAPKGKPHAADASVARQRVNVVGALGYATGKVWHDWHGQTVKRNAVVDLIDRIAQREQRMPLTLVVLDNARIHHNFDPQKLDEWLVGHRLVLMHLPPYSPELNPIGIVWKQAKYHWRRFVTWSKDGLLEEVQKLMIGVGSDFKIGFS